jgi:hypothetical protein
MAQLHRPTWVHLAQVRDLFTPGTVSAQVTPNR